jgi:hypothetical protein
MSEPRFHPEHADDNLGIPDDAGPRAIERIHKLIRERNALQARVMDMASIGREIELATLKAADLADMEAKEAEARGYRRGVEDAKKAAWKWIPRCDCREAISALLEQTSDTNSPHPENGTGMKSET